VDDTASAAKETGDIKKERKKKKKKKKKK